MVPVATSSNRLDDVQVEVGRAAAGGQTDFLGLPRCPGDLHRRHLHSRSSEVAPRLRSRKSVWPPAAATPTAPQVFAEVITGRAHRQRSRTADLGSFGSETSPIC
jgi:hypothetical protein